ncbi:MAG: glycosyltransferase [Leptolyngbyaceae cyanobacterium SM1_4_3]|nr:glycosyltransferase [Leptolyngbyaceae cyanobacterium SM1_4_3]
MSSSITSRTQSLTSTQETSTLEPEVTLVVVPRERFQFAERSLESLYENTSFPFKLIYVDNNSPAKLRRYLESQAQAKGFQLVRSEYYLSPNQARNLGLSYVHSKYVVFVDNDVIFSPGWLKALVNCTKETGATVVGSLVCQYQPVHEIIHCAGGEYMSPEELAKFVKGEPTVPQVPGETGKWTVHEKTYFQNRRVEEVSDRLKREPIGFVEFHAMLVQTSLFEQIGYLDEGFSCTKEYIDFCMTVMRAGGTVYFEPASVVTFLTHPPAPPLNWADLPYFMIRWSDAWERESLMHFQEKWNLTESKYFQKRYKKLGWRRREELIKPWIAQLPFLSKERAKELEKQLVVWERKLNHYWFDRYTRKLAKAKRIQPPHKNKLTHQTDALHSSTPPLEKASASRMR